MHAIIPPQILHPFGQLSPRHDRRNREVAVTSHPPNPKPQTPNPKPKTQNPKPKTQNPKPKTQNPKPQTALPRSHATHAATRVQQVQLPPSWTARAPIAHPLHVAFVSGDFRAHVTAHLLQVLGRCQTLNRKPVSNPKPQTPSPKTIPPSPKPQTTNHKPQTANRKPQTPNPKPQTPNLVVMGLFFRVHMKAQ